jgi:isorenieratene synthase
MDRVDYVVVGGGCAGLSLAAGLARSVTGARILIVEPRAEYVHDRHFCFFEHEAHPYSDAVAHRWARWSVRAGGKTVGRTAEGVRYACIPSDRFYAQMERVLGELPQVSFLRGASVLDLVESKDLVRVRTTSGIVDARLAFDSRPWRGMPNLSGAVAGARGASSDGRSGMRAAGPAPWVQDFLGRVVRAPRDVFDPDEAILMDFDVEVEPGGAPVHFVYVLPFDERTALVESTSFAGERLGRVLHEHVLDRYLRRVFALDPANVAVLHEERAALPMALGFGERRGRSRIVPVGVRGGAARPSSGYAFVAIQRQVDALVRQLQRRPFEPLAAPPPRPARHAALDATFLSYLQHAPERTGETFVQLFDKTPPDSLARFLSEGSTLRDELAVMQTMPVGAMWREVARSAPAWWSGALPTDRLVRVGRPLPSLDASSPIETMKPDWEAANLRSIERALERALALPTGGWYVVAESRKVQSAPSAVVAAGRELVVFRDDAGQPHVAPRACPHMGADLSAGCVRGGALVCPWHGLALTPHGRGAWRPLPTYDDGVLLWVQLERSNEPKPRLPPRPVQFVDAVMAMDAACEPRDVLQNRLDPWHGVHFHPHSFATLSVTRDDGDVLGVRVSYRIAGPFVSEVDATFHCSDARTIVMTIVGGEGKGSVVETHATPIGPGRTRIFEATLATSDRAGFRVALAMRHALRPLVERRARRLWVEDAAYAERLYALRQKSVHQIQIRPGPPALSTS